MALVVAAALLAGGVAVAPTAGANPAPDVFVVGAAKRAITPTSAELSAGVYLGGYGIGATRRATGNLDATWARAVVIGVGDQRVALVTLDLVGMGNIWMRAVRDGVAAATGISARGVMVNISHSHGALDFQGIWGGVPLAYRQRVVAESVAAVQAAVATQEPAELRVATTEVSDLHANRRGQPTRDDTLSAMQFTRPEPGSGVIATLVNYAAHPTVTSSSDMKISTDFVGPAVTALETAYPGSVGLFVNGTLGDISPRPPAASVGDQRSDRQRLGEAIAARAVTALGDPGVVQEIPAGMATSGGSVTFTPAGTQLALAIGIPADVSPLNGYYDLKSVGSPPRITAELLAVRLGSGLDFTTIITFPGEPLSSTGISLRAQVGGKATFLFATTNESLGYLVPPAEWTPGGYEEGVSLEQYAGQKARTAIDANLETLASLPLADFTDVSSGASFARGVDWLVANDLTQGYGGPRTFAPKVTLNRAQMALFLWRLMGSPEPVTSPCGFTDMAGRPDEQIDATCWLKEAGVTRGTNAEGTLYGPSAPVTRAAMGAFMFRLAGGTSDSPVCGFTDAPVDDEFARAACWMKTNSITTGTNTAGTVFSPRNAVTRGQMAAFLFRLAFADGAWGNPRPPLAQNG